MVGVTLISGWLIFPSFLQLSDAHLFGPPNLAQSSVVPGAIIPAVVAFGLIHGLDPSHGWPVAILYSMRTKKPMLFGLLSSGIIAGAHFLSAVGVVAAFVYITQVIIVPQLYLRFGAAIALGLLAYIFWREGEDDVTEHEHIHLHDSVVDVEHEHTHPHQHKAYHSHSGIDQKKAVRSLKGIAVMAFVLGFAHEEQFVVLSFAAGNVDPLALIIAYTTAVSLVIVGLTLLALKVYKHLEERIIKYTKYLPKITASLLAAMAVAFATGIMTR